MLKNKVKILKNKQELNCLKSYIKLYLKVKGKIIFS